MSSQSRFLFLSKTTERPCSPTRSEAAAGVNRISESGGDFRKCAQRGMDQRHRDGTFALFRLPRSGIERDCSNAQMYPAGCMHELQYGHIHGTVPLPMMFIAMKGGGEDPTEDDVAICFGSHYTGNQCKMQDRGESLQRNGQD